jgi:hypothetical protein
MGDFGGWDLCFEHAHYEFSFILLGLRSSDELWLNPVFQPTQNGFG